ncbi:MAG TPA: hypothetical protein VKS81_00575, partial [Bacteroidota bacterium]|nr:hypothetical protein [Bacteroidota bacterium]
MNTIIQSRKVLLIVALLFVTAVAAFGQGHTNYYVWNGSVDTTWTNGANWTPNRTGIQTTLDTMVLDGTASNQPSINTSQTVGNLWVTGGTNLLSFNNGATAVVLTLQGTSDVLDVSSGATLRLNTSLALTVIDSLQLGIIADSTSSGGEGGGNIYGTLVNQSRVHINVHNARNFQNITNDEVKLLFQS